MGATAGSNPDAMNTPAVRKTRALRKWVVPSCRLPFLGAQGLTSVRAQSKSMEAGALLLSSRSIKYALLMRV